MMDLQSITPALYFLFLLTPIHQTLLVELVELTHLVCCSEAKGNQGLAHIKECQTG
jgi:hypothetical protein